ncbi:class I SAM-dependent methyltransferase [Patescibacteria group bacterium]
MSKEDHFHMSEEYIENSASQQKIGLITIAKLIEELKSSGIDTQKMKVLDIACGPGNMTIDLQQALRSNFPESHIEVAGLDYTAENVEKLIKASRCEIQGIVGSFFDTHVEPESITIIFSNEGLHWQPPYNMDEIIYSHLPNEQRDKYSQQALEHFETAIANIFEALDQDGLAVLQFGHEGQLQKQWDLIRDILNEDEFTAMKPHLNMALFYPKVAEIEQTLKNVGFRDFEVSAFNEDLAEESVDSIVGGFRTYTEPALQKYFSQDLLDSFYSKMKEKLEQMDLAEYRKDQWCRTIVKARKFG